MTGFLILLGLTAIYLVALTAESIRYGRLIRRIPLRITVSGTRGKTSTVRTLASVYRSHGIRTVAKTTGSEATYILPDGSEEKIRRKGATTILEQKRLINWAVKLNAECIITEIMSIHPENHRTETRKLIRPQVTLFTNFRADHTDVVGESVQEISELFVNDIFPGSTVIVPEAELNDQFRTGALKNQAKILIAPIGSNIELNIDESSRRKQIPVNLDLVITAARLQNIPDEAIESGIAAAKLDVGQLTIYRLPENTRKIWFINAFAANDPLSTRQVMDKTMSILADELSGNTEICALLSLRSDRGERSQQWLRHLDGEGRDQFSKIFVTGIHARLFTRKLENCERLLSSDPAKMIRQINASTQGDLIIFGIANIHGPGEHLLAHLNLLPQTPNPIPNT